MMRFEDVSKLCDCWLCGWFATRGLFKIGSNRCLRVLTLTAAVSSVKRTPSGHQADTKRTPSGHQADTKRTPSGHQESWFHELMHELTYKILQTQSTISTSWGQHSFPAAWTKLPLPSYGGHSMLKAEHVNGWLLAPLGCNGCGNWRVNHQKWLVWGYHEDDCMSVICPDHCRKSSSFSAESGPDAGEVENSNMPWGCYKML